MRTQRASEAIPCFDFALKATPKDAAVLTWKGEAYQALEKPTEALAAFEEAIEADPARGDAWRGKGLVHVKLEKFPQAAEALARATEARKDDKALWTMRGFAEERAGQYDLLALLHLRRFEDALKCFDAALALDPGYEPAADGKRRAEERVHAVQIEGFAEAVVRFEKHLTRPATRDEIFKYCSVPLETLDEVIRYVNEPATLAPDRVEPDELRKYEAVGAAVLQHVGNAANLDSIRLTDVSTVLPHVDLDEARTIWGYIDWVRDAPLEPTAEWHNDDLIRQALDLPKEEWNLVDLAKELHLGPFEAKKLEVSLKIFEGGGYRISTRAPPESKPKKVKAETHVAHAKVETPETEDHAVPEGPSLKPAAKASPDPAAVKCEAHHAPGVERHTCGAWLCKACVETGSACPGCNAPLVKVDREARKKDREADFSRL